MSRIGREPITIPAGVTVTVAEGNVVTVKGKLGEVTETFNPGLGINVDGATLTVTRPCDDKEYRALHGLTRALIANMVKGVTEGFQKKLEIVGVGYKVEKQGKGKKIMIFKYKPKNGSSHRRQGHRQPYTKLTIKSIEA